MPGITVTQACKSYETSHYTVKAVNHANLSVESGEAVAIVGPSGSGKSTLLNIIGLILKPDSGSVAVDGKEVLNMSDRRCSAFRNASFGYIVQDFALLDDETVYHNIRIPCFTTGRSSAGSISPESGRSRRSWTYQTS